jgi:ABC-type maltose transport system permease subunit
VVATLVFIAPILWMIVTAFKTGTQAFLPNPVFLFKPTLNNFSDVLTGSGFELAVVNGLQVSVISSLLAIVFASGIAYPMERFPFRGQRPAQLVDPILSRGAADGYAGRPLDCSAQLCLILERVPLRKHPFGCKHTNAISDAHRVRHAAWHRLDPYHGRRVIVVLPVWLGALAAQKCLFGGLTLGAVK